MSKLFRYKGKPFTIKGKTFSTNCLLVANETYTCTFTKHTWLFLDDVRIRMDNPEDFVEIESKKPT